MLLRTGPSPRRSGFGHAGGTVRGPAVAVLCAQDRPDASQFPGCPPSHLVGRLQAEHFESLPQDRSGETGQDETR